MWADVEQALLKVFERPPRKTRVNVRHPERLEITTGLEPIELDMNWVWAAYLDGKQVAGLVVGNCHGIAFLLRLVALPEAPPSAVLRLLRVASEDCRNRGLRGFLSMFDLTNPVDRKLWNIAKRLGAVQVGKVHVLAMGWRML